MLGIYYEPGSQMARLCVQGAKRVYEYCEQYNLPCERVGKFIIAKDESGLRISSRCTCSSYVITYRQRYRF
jgi:2-hydroxyglutarate dehydrogenase